MKNRNSNMNSKMNNNVNGNMNQSKNNSKENPITEAGAAVAEDNGTKQLVEMAKEKLRWYTLEASEEEFDEEAVDALVRLISTLEQDADVERQSSEAALAHFREYCDLRKEDEAGREALQKQSRKRNSNKKTMRFPRKGLAGAALAACLVMFIAVGGSMGSANAGGTNGFLHWLRKDDKGVTLVASLENVGAGVDKNEEYDAIEEIPKECEHYMVDQEAIATLRDYEFESAAKENGENFQWFWEKFVSQKTGQEVEIGVFVYEGEALFFREKYGDYDFLHTKEVLGVEQQVFMKKDVYDKAYYFISFYHENKKYFVQGIEDLELLEQVAAEYVEYVLGEE